MNIALTEPPAFYQDLLPAGSHWSLLMRRGTSLRLTDEQGGLNVGMLFYNPYNLLERYNAPDTLKCQHSFKLTAGHCLYSDMGRIFCAITADSCGWHETLCGSSTAAQITTAFGRRDYQQYRNARHQNGHDSFLIEAAKYGLGEADLGACVNFFAKVVADEQGQLRYQADASQAGDFVELRFEMDTLVLLHTCPHPLHPGGDYPASPLRYQLRLAEPMSAGDLCLNHCAENQRGYQNNALYHLGR